MPNAKVRLKKSQTIDELQKIIGESSVAIITNYRGIKTAELTTLRVKLRNAKMGFKVVKNTLARNAAGGAKKAALKSVFDGPIAMAYGYGEDVAAPAKLIIDHITSTKSTMTIAGGFLGDQPITIPQVTELSKMPPKKVVIGQVLGALQGPLYGLVGVLNAPAAGLVGVLEARIKQLEAK
ncbi:50S ribosomal protein L10 [Dehalogenimonas etheniformans]|uniref:Large ribosomal subunit protein uL10 n=1 Tax=Dehalogenimonas etheniformans TaxID=1536648 RepID=A0A2P5P8T8_9CHLR|nr:50S ribosomal protein L10 [Dehalogenimonas etheniformans]PPD58709.1 50S ribosomal protein L10 [Dehalogenimonas etheniformans]QNT76524.1 50S ribosomal protein L10 [Dehalogenimonas etheniformans]